jgi:DNA-binding NtrC family response regulator
MERMADKKKRIMLIDNEEGLCRMMQAVLEDSGYEIKAYVRSFEAVEDFKPGEWDLVVSDIKMPGMDGLEVLQRIKQKEPGIPVIMITAYATVEMSIQALRKGAYDMLTKPFEPEELLYRVKNALKHTQLLTENRELREELVGKFRFDNIIGSSAALKELLDKVAKIAIRDTSVLITGESGTGKELIAQAIHYNSLRKDKKFVAINCGALPETLLESELFGCKKGAYTGANADRQGLLEAADGGTLFLDEAGNLPMNVQKTLLRFLQEQEFHRIGDTKTIKVDVRIISATNADLKATVKDASFREDLFYRLNVMNLHLPPLRERSADIPLLAAHFITLQNGKFGTQIKGMDAEALEAVLNYPWPGNIRQLKNVIEASMAMESGDYISMQVLSQFIEIHQHLQEDDASGIDESDYTKALSRFEMDYLKGLLRKNRGNIEIAAREAGMNMATIYRKIKKYNLRKDDWQ